MYALFLVLNDTTKLDNIMETFYEIKVGATTLDSIGMGKVLLEHQVDLPFFSSIRKMIEGNNPYNKTIISVIRDEDKLNIAKEKIKNELNYFKEPGVGFMFIVPVIECHGIDAERFYQNEKEID